MKNFTIVSLGDFEPYITIAAIDGVDVIHSSLETHPKTAFQVSCNASVLVLHNISKVRRASQE